MNQENICPECGSRYHQDFVRCPNCHAYIVDTDPWHGSFNLLAIPLALGIWWVFDWLIRWSNLGIENIFADWISRSILGIAIYGIIIMLFKWRILLRQSTAFRLVRRVCATPGSDLGDATLDAARDSIDDIDLGPYNSFIAFHRLRWMVSATKVAREDRQGLLEALRQHSESDWDSLESSYSFSQFLIWLLPSAGFLGTVWGMSQALGDFSGVIGKTDLSFNAGLMNTARSLGTAFHTTLIGLASVIPLLALATTVRRRSQGLLEQMDKFFLRLAAHTLFHAEEDPTQPEHLRTGPQITPSPMMPIAEEAPETESAPSRGDAEVGNVFDDEEAVDGAEVGEIDQETDRQVAEAPSGEAPDEESSVQRTIDESFELWVEKRRDQNSSKGF